jgi:DNA polymerase-4
LQGIGPRTAERLSGMGIATVGDLQAADTAMLVERFGERMGNWLKLVAHFHGSTHVETSRVAKSRSSETTFDTDVADYGRLCETVRKLAADVCKGLEKKGTRGRTIGIKVRYDNWTTLTRDRSLGEFTNDVDVVTTVALALLEENRPERPVRLIGVRVAGFEGVVSGTPSRPAQLKLPVGV